MTVFHAEQAWLGGETLTDDVRIVVEDGIITEVTPGSRASPDAVVLGGVTLPGLVNAHSHVFHRVLRFRTHRLGHDFWLWRETMYQVADRLAPESLERLAAAVFAEMALAGVTTVGEFHYLHHRRGGSRYGDPNAMGHALAVAAATAGVRLALIDTCYLRSGFDAPLEGIQLRFGDGGVAGWGARVDALRKTYERDPMVSIAVAAHSVRGVDPSGLAEIAGYAADGGLPLHVHVSEQPAENRAAIAATGRTPVGLLAEAGTLGPGTAVVHATHLTGDDIALLGDAGVTAVLCPTTERDLGDGLGPGWELAAAGTSLAVGSDQHAVIDLFAEARGVELHDRLRLGRRGVHSPAALLAAATAGGARALGLAGGVIAAGAAADLVAVRIDTPRLAGAPDDDPVAAIVFGATASDVTDVVVAGDHIVAAGSHLRVPDVADRLAASVGELVAAR